MKAQEENTAKHNKAVRFRYIESKKDKVLITLLFSWAYFCSYTTRLNYKTVISAIVESEGMKMDMAAAALTGMFITYGIGQLISGWLGDRIEPKFLISGGLVLSSALNILLPLNTDVAYMTVIWCVNGFGQALIWPPIVKTLSNFLEENDYRRSAVKVLWGSNIAVIVLYLVCPPIISLCGGWKSVFFISAAVGLAGAVSVFIATGSFERKYAAIPCTEAEVRTVGGKNEENVPGNGPEKMRGGAVILLFALLVLMIAAQGALRDGVDTWIPSYISSTFGLSTAISILSGVILPVFAILSYSAASAVFGKLKKNEILCCACFFIASVVCSAALLAVRLVSPDGNAGVFAYFLCAALSVLVLALLVGCMHAVNMICTCFIPARFRVFGNISFVAGLINFGTYVGSAAATYGFALIAEKSGWTGTVISWIALSVSGVLLCIACFIPWKKMHLSANPDKKTPESSE
ncbi:MAG: MFS transporter [Clostridia bacterium]|nr:MFS transporter [Clostridia bacterium]